MSEKTGATERQVLQAGVSLAQARALAYGVGESENAVAYIYPSALQVIEEAMGYLVPKGYCIVRESFVDATKALVGDYHEAAGVAVSGLGKMQDVELELEKMEAEK